MVFKKILILVDFCRDMDFLLLLVVMIVDSIFLLSTETFVLFMSPISCKVIPDK